MLQGKELADDLLGLRAGISLIFQKIEKKRSLEGVIYKLQEDVRKSNETIQYYERSLSNMQNERWQAEREEQEKKKNYEKIQIENKNHQKLTYEEKITYLAPKKKFRQPLSEKAENVIIFIGVALFVASILFDIFLLVARPSIFDSWGWSAVLGLDSKFFDRTIGFIGVAAGSFIAVVVAIIIVNEIATIVYSLILIPQGTKAQKEKIQEADSAMKNWEQIALKEWIESKNKLEETKNMIVYHSKWETDYINEAKNARKESQQRIQTFRGKIGELINEINWLENRLHQTYASYFDPCLWADLDSVIFYLGKGFADTLKEALQLLHQQHQADRIVSAIYASNQSICEIINERSRQMGEALSKSFSVISGQLSAISNQLDQNNLQLQKNNEKLSELIHLNKINIAIASTTQKVIQQKMDIEIKASELRNALIEKANEKSEEMIKELGKFRKELKK